jgi:suppressor for copper-sensitivity B
MSCYAAAVPIGRPARGRAPERPSPGVVIVPHSARKTGRKTIYLPDSDRPDEMVVRMLRRLICNFAAVALLAAWCAPGTARAAASAWGGDANARVRLISATAATGTAQRLDLGLEFRLAPGWHIYWRTPGDTGYPPSADWAGSDNLATASLAWPAPQRYDLLGVETIAYQGTVVLPVLATLAHPGAPLRLSAALDYLACSNICVPYQAALALDLPAGTAAPSPEAALVADAAGRVPLEPAQAGLTLLGAQLLGPADQPRLAVELAAQPPLRDPDIFVEHVGRGFAGKPRLTALAGGQARLELPLYNVTRAEATRLAARDGIALTLVDGARAAALTVQPTAGAETGAAAWLGMLGTALLGGLILNLMPCVLPVLAVKLAAVGHYGGAARRLVRLGFLASALGILVSFLLLAAGALLVRAGGGAVGWGIQFQQPWFLVGLIAVLTLFAANLWGWLSVDLPRVVADRLTGAPADRVKGGQLAGAFVTGMFATLLATPCSAPFVGTALGFALAGGPAEILTIFAALGVGLALPYLAVALVPEAAGWLPRPGRWMVRLRGLLGLALAGTALWLAVVLAGTAGAPAALGVGALMLLLAGLLALRARRGEPAVRRLAGWAGAGLVALAFAAPPLLATPPPRPALADAAAPAAWHRFEPAQLDRLLGERRVVLVDVTADWCLTCKVNKALVLERGAVAAALAQGRVAGLRADWTRPDPAISDYLASFGRYGIPFNAVYGPGAPGGIALPELLTAEAVLDAVARAGAPDVKSDAKLGALAK